MLTEEQFLARVLSHAKPRRKSDYMTCEDMVDMLTCSWDVKRAEKNIDMRREMFGDEAFGVSTAHPDLIKMAGLALFFELHEAKAAINDATLMGSWVYDITTGITILNLNRGAHAGFTSTLLAIYKADDHTFAPR